MAVKSNPVSDPGDPRIMTGSAWDGLRLGERHPARQVQHVDRLIRGEDERTFLVCGERNE